MHIHFRLLFRRASEPSSSDRTAKQQIAYAQNSSIIQEIWTKSPALRAKQPKPSLSEK